MKFKLALIVILSSFFLNGFTQDFTFSKSRDGKINFTGDKTKKNQTISFLFESSFKNSILEIWDADSKQIASLNNKNKFGKDLQKDEKGKYPITIQNDGKIKECNECPKIPNDFTLKIAGSFFGPFHLKPDTITHPNTIPHKDSSKTLKEYNPGYVLFDAVNLRNLPLESAVLKLKILKTSYGIESQQDIENNKFLNATIGTFNEIRGSVEELTPANTVSSIGGLDVTNIADGFAKFIVKRSKQELSITFFENFKNALDSIPDFRTVFPQTSRALNAISDQIYNYQAYIQTLRECFEKDLASLPSNLPTIIENHKQYFEKMSDLKAKLNAGFYIAQSFQDKQHPGNIIEMFPIDTLDGITNHNIKPAFQTLQLLSTSLKNNSETDTYWAPYTDIKKLFSDDTLLYIYLGLLEQKAKMDSIVFINASKKPIPLWKIIDTSYSSLNVDLPKYKTYIKDIALKMESLESKIGGLKKIRSDSLLFENYYTVVASSLELMNKLTQVENLPHFQLLLPGLQLQKSTKPYFDIAQTASDIVIDVNRRNYSSAIVNGIYIYNLAFNEDSIKNYLNNTSSTAKKNDKIEKYKKISTLIFKYGSFMATVVQAKNADEIEAVIEDFVLPVGSARIKRETSFNVSLNAYCGFFFGAEKIKGVDYSFKWNSYGVAAPIGISISRGHSFMFLGTKGWEKGKYGWSSSFFLSIIDIGALTAFRFADDSTKSIPNIQLKDIISPGIFYSMGIPKSPISINVGWQVGPLLREVSKTVNNFSQSFSRFSVSVCVDLPVLNLYSKPKY